MKALKLNKRINTYKPAALITAIIIMLLAGNLFTGCKKSLSDGIVFSIGTSSFKYTALVKVRDAGNSKIAPGNLAVSVTGPNSNLVYDLVTGKKKLTINKDGTIQLLISPNSVLTGPVSFNLSVTSPGYFPYQKTITINPRDSSQTITVPLRTPASSIQSGAIAGQAQFGLVKGALAKQSIVKITSDNTTHAVTGISQQAINSAGRSLNSTSPDGSTPANQVTYYDDGLTSVVLPQGTTFHYWELKPTGVMITDTIEVPHIDSVTIPVKGVATGSITAYKTYYTKEAYTYPQTEWVKETVSSSTDSIAVIVNYAGGDNVSTKIEFASDSYTDPTIHTTLTNQDVPESQLLFKTAVREKLTGNPVFYRIHHQSTISYFDLTTNTTVTKSVTPFTVYDQEIFPDQSAQWFTSFVIDPTVINPLTNEPMKAGDLVEIGTDSTNKTITQTVTQVANGQLRVQMLSYDAGFYYKAPYLASFNYTINTNAISVADPENATCSISLLDGNIGLYFSGEYGGYSQYSFAGEIASASPISANSSAQGTYWGRQVFNQNFGLTASIAPFNFSPPYPTARFYIEAHDKDADVTDAEVSTKPVSGKNYAAVTIYSGFSSPMYGAGQVNIKNGSWATNAFPTGAVISGTGYIDNYKLNLASYTIIPGINYMYWLTPNLD